MLIYRLILALLLAAPNLGAEEITIPRRTMFDVRMEGNLHSDKAREGDTFKATTLDPVFVHGRAVVPAGSTVEGVVTRVKSRATGNASSVLGLRFTKLRTGQGHVYDIKGALVGFRHERWGNEKSVASIRASDDKAVIVIGKEGAGPGDRSSSVVGAPGQPEEDLATTWAHSGLSHDFVAIDAGSEITFTLLEDIKVQADK